ncbi:MAG: hypothetical protein AAFP69_06505, partial [Planctomycetota bacterium]
TNRLGIPTNQQVAEDGFHYYDVETDGRITATDSLRVITRLAEIARGGSRSGESSDRRESVFADWPSDIGSLF